jgi:hypothetical protein
VSDPVVRPGEGDVDKNRAHAHKRPTGFIVFCEEKLRYEGGFKAWIFLGPYLLGALVLEMIITEHTKTAKRGLWIVFLGYLILFPRVWRRILTLASFKNRTPVAPSR